MKSAKLNYKSEVGCRFKFEKLDNCSVSPFGICKSKRIIKREEMVKESRWWWFESHKSTKHSEWLHSTLTELDAKTKAMLRLIEGNADSFAQRAETYYKKRPELISFVEDFYRAHRSLAERFDHLKSPENRASKFHQEAMESVCDSNSEFEDADSEIEDPQEDEERLKLVDESDALRRQLLEKDEEKREVIRQLALTVESLKDENLRLKRRLGEESVKKHGFLDFNPLDKFLGKLFSAMCDGKRIV